MSNLLVVCDEQIYEKPHDVEEALRMSSQLSGSTFDIVTGLAVYDSQSMKMLSTTESGNVRFRDLTNREISDYVSRYPVVKCAGAFEGDGLLRFAE